MTLSLSISLVASLFLNLFPQAYFSFFGQAGKFNEEGTPVLRIVSLALVLMSMSTVWLSAITGTGNSKITFLIELVAILFYCVYVYAILEWLQWSIAWGWAAEVIYWTLLGGLSFLYIRSGRWKTSPLPPLQQVGEGN